MPVVSLFLLLFGVQAQWSQIGLFVPLMMVRLTIWAFVGCALGAALEGRDFIEADLASYEARGEQWPYGPFKTEGRDIVNSRGDKITWAGVNWPLSGKIPLAQRVQ